MQDQSELASNRDMDGIYTCIALEKLFPDNIKDQGGRAWGTIRKLNQCLQSIRSRTKKGMPKKDAATKC